jgi:hypothetical protein
MVDFQKRFGFVSFVSLSVGCAAVGLFMSQAYAKEYSKDDTPTHKENKTFILEQSGQNKLPETASFVPKGFVDTFVSIGSERSLTGADVFYPLGWNGKFMGFTDVRVTASSDSSVEGNLGFGVRRMNDAHTGIFGLYGYLDQRKTQYDNAFTQVTAGTEWLAENWEIRANSYIPLSGNKTAMGDASPSLAFSGSGLVASGENGLITEVPNYGVDTELGLKAPLPAYDYLKNLWGYVGAYHFDSDETKAIDGYRLRAKAAITDKLSLEAEWRADNLRDEEALIGARLRFPLGDAPQSTAYVSPLYERLTQQPVRDVDIVTQGKKD